MHTQPDFLPSFPLTSFFFFFFFSPNLHHLFRRLRQVLLHSRNSPCPSSPSLWIHPGSSSIPSKIPVPLLHILPLLPFSHLYPSPNQSDPKSGVAREGWMWGSTRHLSRGLAEEDRRRSRVGIRDGGGRGEDIVLKIK